MEFSEEYLGRICRFCGFPILNTEISYLANLIANEETAYRNLINFVLIFERKSIFPYRICLP